jgi:nucleoside-triphosphatase
MAKIFLTGPVQVGKTTLIDRVLNRLALRIGGMRTRRVSLDRAHPRFTLTDIGTGESSEFARRRGTEVDVDTRVFERAGAEAVRRGVREADLIVLDELGRMELEAEEFQRAVFESLDSEKPVLGSIKPEENPFLDAVRSHPAVEVIPVTEENRDALVEVVLGKLRSGTRGTRRRGDAETRGNRDAGEGAEA